MNQDQLPIADRHAVVASLLARMTLEEKIGQLQQVNGAGGHVPEDLAAGVRSGAIGSVINEVDPATLNELQRLAREESRLGIPLLIGRDVIHGFQTVLPIPLGQAATWNRSLVQAGAALAAHEAAATGVNWTFAPMLDVSRDPRWGRIAESLGEDPVLTGELGAAMVRGFQGDDLAAPGSILACLKHFAGYGASESGRDYNTTNIPEAELRNVYFPPFKACLDAGAASIMPGFSDLNGIPPSGNAWLLDDVLRGEWQFDGLVVSDWASISQLSVHGLTEDDRQATVTAINAGVNIDMASNAYTHHLGGLVNDGLVSTARLDMLVAEVLGVKYRLGLLNNDGAQHEPQHGAGMPDEADLLLAKQLAQQSIVLLKNNDMTLPLHAATLASIAVIGPLADDPHEQMGTWVFDGDAGRSQTLVSGLKDLVGGQVAVNYQPGLDDTRSTSHQLFAAAIACAAAADVVVLVLGEEAILSGEAHCRADIDLPGAQQDLLNAIHACGKPVVLVVMAGRPLVLAPLLDKADALLFAWHPGSMGGPALAELLLGIGSPSGKLPVTFPRKLGQVPIYYAHKHTGKPPTPDTVVHMNDIPRRAAQLSVGNTSFHLDVDPSPQFAFGFGLSYSHFDYEDLCLDRDELALDGTLHISVMVRNAGQVAAAEIVQLYIRDLVGSITRPVKELKDFARVNLAPGEQQQIDFALPAAALAFYNGRGAYCLEPGRFQLWVGGCSVTGLQADFGLLADASAGLVANV